MCVSSYLTVVASAAKIAAVLELRAASGFLNDPYSKIPSPDSFRQIRKSEVIG